MIGSFGSGNVREASLDDLSPVKRALLEHRRSGSSDGRPLRPVERPPAGGVLSFAQQRLWLLDQLFPNLTAYNVVRAIRLHGRLDVAALSGALDLVVCRHEVLRSRIVVVDGHPRLMTDPARPVGLTVEDLRTVDQRDAAVNAALAAEADQRFDLSKDTLLRARLLRVAAEHWVLILSTHHIASDEASRSILYAELGAAYGALHVGRAPELPTLPVQYADWAAWQRGQLAGPRLGADLDWWRGKLAAAPPALALPTDRPGATGQTLAGARFLDLLDPELSERLHTLSRRHGVTLFTTVLAGFATLLARYGGNDDVVVGFPVSGRTVAEIEGLLGYFSNMLVARVDASGDPTFVELLDRTRTVVVEALSHAEVPFERLVEELAPDRRLDLNPLFRVALSVETASQVVPQLSGLTATPLEAVPTQAKFELALVVADLGAGRLRLEWEYSSAQFGATEVSRMSGHLRTVLAAAAADPELRLSAIAIVDPVERGQLERWGSGPRNYVDSAPTLPARFAAVVRAHPDRVAVRSGDGSLSYAELDAASSRLAGRLAALGAGPGALVGVYLDRGTELVVSLLGVLRTGAAYVPLDPAFPAERIAFMLGDSNCLALVTTEGLLSTLPDLRPATVLVETGASAPISQPEGHPAADPSPDALAYVIYTSGSTGTPKGVMIEHASLGTFLRSMAREPGLTEDDVLVAVTTPSFDIAALELFLPLWVGAQVVVAGQEEASDPGRLATLLNRTGATVLQATPATWRSLMHAGWPGRSELRAFCGGEALPSPLATQLLHRCGQVWNLYGPTETTIWSLVSRLEAPLEQVPIGRPIDGTEVFVVDRYDRLVPVGVPGELLIGGVGTARGYLRRPGLTAQRFVDLPVAGGRRVYRTGDLVRWRADGQLAFIGRIDHQVKLRGFRIELGEVEAALRDRPGVSDAAVVLREDTPGDARLVGYVTGDESLDVPALRRSVGQRLPAYMVPPVIVRLAEMPRSPNGKLDRSALATPTLLAHSSSSHVPPGTPVERALGQMWADVLGVERIGRHDDFFGLGGHSLLIVQLAARVQQELGVSLPLRAAYERSTLAGMATLVSAGLLGELRSADLAMLLEELEGLSAE